MGKRTPLEDLIVSNHLRDGVSLDCLTPLDNGDVEMITTLEDGTETSYTIPVSDIATIYHLASQNGR
ncbi:MAG: hypothetical protein ACYDER_07955 [Ktedonobacteraceae bacterium]